METDQKVFVRIVVMILVTLNLTFVLYAPKVMSFRNNMKLIKGHLNREVDDYDIAS